MEWSKDDPKTDGVYWWRADRLDFEPDIHSVAVGRFYQIGEMHSCEVEGFGGEWLGPITPAQAEQFDALRKVTREARDVLALLVPYGKIHTVDGVRYPDGSHSEAVDRGERVLNDLRRALGKQE